MNSPANEPSDAIGLLRRDKLEEAVLTLTAAFDGDPIYTHVFPSNMERTRYLTPFWRAILRNALLHNHVYATTDATGVACWLPPGKRSVSFIDSLSIGFAFQRAVNAFPAQARRRFDDFVRYADGVQQNLMGHTRYWELWVLGVRPGRQRQGLGGQLMAPVLKRASREGLPCYLLTESEYNVNYYHRRGFEVAYEGTVPGHPLQLWMMIREPHVAPVSSSAELLLDN